MREFTPRWTDSSRILTSQSLYTEFLNIKWCVYLEHLLSHPPESDNIYDRQGCHLKPCACHWAHHVCLLNGMISSLACASALKLMLESPGSTSQLRFCFFFGMIIPDGRFPVICIICHWISLLVYKPPLSGITAVKSMTAELFLQYNESMRWPNDFKQQKKKICFPFSYLSSSTVSKRAGSRTESEEGKGTKRVHNETEATNQILQEEKLQLCMLHRQVIRTWIPNWKEHNFTDELALTR